MRMLSHRLEHNAGAVRRLEYWALSLTLLSVVARYIVMGSSVAMMAAILEDFTELIAPVAILLTLKLETRPADSRHPYGYERIGSLSFFSAALALLVLGVLTCWQGLAKLLAGGAKDFGDITLLGATFWQGWLMIAVLVVTAVIMLPVLKAKRKLAPEVKLAALQTDAASNQAHIAVALGAALGIFLTRLGWGWADPMVAILVGLVILNDGWRDLKVATAELIDVSPDSDVMESLTRIVEAKPYVAGHYWLARKVGRFIDADLMIAANNVPMEQADLWRKELDHDLRQASWQLHDLTIAIGVEIPLAKKEDGARSGVLNKR